VIDIVTNSNAVATTASSGAPYQSATLEPGAQYDFAAIFDSASGERNTAASDAADPSDASSISSLGSMASAIAAATTTVTDAVTTAADATATVTAASTTTAAQTATAADAATTTTATTPGIEALVSAIIGGTFVGTNVTDPSKLQEINPLRTDTVPSFYFASDQTAAQLAQLLGGKVVQMPPFGQDKGWSEPNANFIELPNGQTFNAADVAYFSKVGVPGAAQLTSDITATINTGAAWTNWYQNGGQMPSFAPGYVGPPITGMVYPAGSIGPDGNVINPSSQNSVTQGA
jgi:hypothetical protein